MTVRERLFALRDEEFAAFEAKLAPTVAPESCIGVRVPQLRELAKELRKDGSADTFIAELPHTYYDENLLHSVLLSDIRDFDTALYEVERFLPYIDNWAVCDTLKPKAFNKNKAALLEKLRGWIASPETYVCRYGIDELMSRFLDGDFKPEYLELPAAVHSDEYYVRMMQAWYFATALAKQWDATVPFLEQNRLDTWVHNKTIQKARESFRITEAQKAYLKTLKR